MSFYTITLALWIVFVFAVEPPFAKRTGRTNRWLAVSFTLLAAGIAMYAWLAHVWYSPAHAILHLLDPISP